MNDLEEKLNQVLRDPNMMQQIMTLAQSLGSEAPQPAQENPPSLPFDPGMLTKLAGSGIDPNQRALLHALSPYVSRDRAHKLEKAMRAAGMARLASAFLLSSGGR